MTQWIVGALPLLVVLVMTIVGMDLRAADFLRVRRHPVLVPAIVIGQWVALTLVAGLVGWLLDMPQAVAGGALLVVAGGALLVAAAPVATLSNYYTQLARGHLALAVTVTAVSNALAPLATPLVAAAGFGLFLDESADCALPLATVARQAAAGLLLPLLAGMLIRNRAPAWTTRWRARLQVLSLLAIALVFVAVVADQFEAIRDRFAIYLGASAAFTAAMLATGLPVARLAARSAEDRRALVWGFPARNFAVATLIATAAVGRAQMLSFAAVLFATQIAVLVPLGWRLGRRSGERPAA